jgi:hypothetical protein
MLDGNDVIGDVHVTVAPVPVGGKASGALVHLRLSEGTGDSRCSAQTVADLRAAPWRETAGSWDAVGLRRR